jgi:hypothetical protein
MHLLSPRLFRLLPNIKGNQSQTNQNVEKKRCYFQTTPRSLTLSLSRYKKPNQRITYPSNSVANKPCHNLLNWPPINSCASYVYPFEQNTSWSEGMPPPGSSAEGLPPKDKSPSFSWLAKKSWEALPGDCIKTNWHAFNRVLTYKGWNGLCLGGLKEGRRAWRLFGGKYLLSTQTWIRSLWFNLFEESCWNFIKSKSPRTCGSSCTRALTQVKSSSASTKRKFYWVVRKKISPNFYSLPMMFEKNLSSNFGTRCLADVFIVCLEGICRLGKKIGFRKISHFHKKFQFSLHPIFLPSLRIPAEQPSNTPARHLLSPRLFKFLPDIIGNE